MRSNSAAPERICCYGHEGTGKTRIVADLAVVNPDANFYVLNHEPGAYERLLDGYPTLQENVEWTDVRDWVTLVETTRAYRAKAKVGDWLVVENASRAWDGVQQAYEEHYARQQGWSSEDLFATVPVDDSPGKWVKINGEYYRWVDALVDPATNPAHLLVTAPEKPVVVPQGKKGEWADDKQTVEMFYAYGMKPDAQKRLAHQMHTVLWMKHPRAGEWTFTSVKDRERKLVEDAPMVPSFPYCYLAALGGWTS